jgi:opacity protein-like surface antigen
MMRLLAFVGFVISVMSNAAAQDVSFSGMTDLRLVAPSGQNSNLDGGLGKFQWGDGRGSPVIPDLDQAVLKGSVVLTPDLRVVTELRYDPRQKTAVDIIDAYFRYRPVSISRWRWSVKTGAFFPPVSLENTGIGWAPEWTLTSSAINSWVGEELRILGGEATIEWRGDVDRFELSMAAFGWNEPAGVAIAAYGWTFTDRATGLFDHLRLPSLGNPPPPASYGYEFRQFDHSVGWYVGFTWERPDLGRIVLLRYDNDADPNAHDSAEFGWRTKFWSVGASTQFGPVVVLAQAMVGTTTIEPFADFTSRTNFWSYYALAGIEHEDWRFAIRFDQFGISQTSPGDGPKGDEQGVAGTIAATWSPRKWLSVITEVLTIDYNQPRRVLIGKPPHAVETQVQIALRLSF